jgi:hypothetical protein
MLAGKDGVGKTSAIISLARFLEMMQPGATFYVIDTENKFRPTLISFGADAPRNISYYKCSTMNDVNAAYDAIVEAHTPGDWLAVESMDRVWERAQDMGYQAITGQGKAEYMEKRRNTAPGVKPPPVTPRPDDLWSVVKGAHDACFMDAISQLDTLNVVMSTTIGRPKDIPGRKENQDRKDLRIEFGIDLNLGGAPKLPYFVQTLILLDRRGGKVQARVLRDNCSVLEDPQVEVEIPTRKEFATAFWMACRG